MSISILIVEDEIKIADVICKYLALEGFSSQHAETGRQALTLMEKERFQLVILDVMLPDLDGFAVCEKIRATSFIPIIMLTARVENVDRLTGFSKGADDYLCKPFFPPELIARVKAVLRRTEAHSSRNVLIYDSITLVINEHNVTVDTQEVSLTQIEFNLLTMFMTSPHQVFTREELLEGIHGKYSETYERTIDFHIKNLRKKINIGHDCKYIKTIYGVGYRFI